MTTPMTYPCPSFAFPSTTIPDQHILPARLGRSAEQTSLVVLAPAVGTAGDRNHDSLLREIQQLRGRVFIEMGAATREILTTDGRFVSPLDSSSWHLALRDGNGAVVGCMRYTIHPAARPFDALPFAKIDFPGDPAATERLRAAVEQVRTQASREGVAFAQAGAWALASGSRRGANALLMVQATFALARLLGDCLAISPAAVTTGADAILCRLGARPLAHEGVEFPVYPDPVHRSDAHLLQFDSRVAAPAYAGLVDRMQTRLAQSRWIVAGGQIQ